MLLLKIKNLGQKNNEGMVLKSKKNNLFGELIVGVSALLLVVFAPHIAFGQKKEVRGFVISMVHTALSLETDSDHWHIPDDWVMWKIHCQTYQAQL